MAQWWLGKKRMALAPIILREEAHCQVRWKSNAKKNCQDSLFVPCLPACPVCSVHCLRKCDGFTSFPRKPKLIHWKKGRKGHKWSCLLVFNEVLNFPGLPLWCQGKLWEWKLPECGEFKTLLGCHKAGLPACRSMGNLVLYRAITARWISPHRLFWLHGIVERKAHQGKLCLRIPRRSRQFDVALMSVQSLICFACICAEEQGKSERGKTRKRLLPTRLIDPATLTHN